MEKKFEKPELTIIMFTGDLDTDDNLIVSGSKDVDSENDID